MASKSVKALNETRIGAQIQLSKPLDRLLASQVDYKEWYDLRIEAMLMQAQMQTSPLRGWSVHVLPDSSSALYRT